MKAARATVLRRVAPACLVGLLALTTSVATANASGYEEEGDFKSMACNTIGCANGTRECARVIASGMFWMYLPILPYFFPMPWTYSAVCYEQPAE